MGALLNYERQLETLECGQCGTVFAVSHPDLRGRQRRSFCALQAERLLQAGTRAGQRLADYGLKPSGVNARNVLSENVASLAPAIVAWEAIARNPVRRRSR